MDAQKIDAQSIMGELWRCPCGYIYNPMLGDTTGAILKKSNMSSSFNFDRYEVLTFDCYGTLIDWESGILSALKPVLSSHYINLMDTQILELYARIESEVEKGEYIKYRDILKKVVHQFGKRLGFIPNQSELNCLIDSLKDWKPFPDTVESLQALKKKFKLAIISNIDNDLFVFSASHLKVKFDWVITAEQVMAYKPSLQNFKFAIEKIGIPPEKILHIAQSVCHDIVPAKTVGLSTIWVNRRKDKKGSGPEKTIFFYEK